MNDRVSLGLIDRHIYYDFCERITSDVEIDEMGTSSFDVCLVREFDIFFFEGDSIFLIDTTSDLMFIEPTEDLGSFSFQGKFERLTIELFLDVKCLCEAQSRLICGSFFLHFDLLHTIHCDLTSEFLRDEEVASLRTRDFDDLTSAPDIRDISEQFNREF